MLHTTSSLQIECSIILKRVGQPFLEIKSSPEIPFFFHSSMIPIAEKNFGQLLELVLITPAMTALHDELEHVASGEADREDQELRKQVEPASEPKQGVQGNVAGEVPVAKLREALATAPRLENIDEAGA